MSVSIYYSFACKEELHDKDALKQVADKWSEAFSGEPYEDWYWYDPELENGLFIYAGAIKLPMDSEQILESMIIATTLLTELRKRVGGQDWYVNLDDSELPWDDEQQSFVPDFAR